MGATATTEDSYGTQGTFRDTDGNRENATWYYAFGIYRTKWEQGEYMWIRRAILTSTVAAGLFLLTPGASFAHHSRAMFDMTKNLTFEGVVKEYRWENPHSHIVVTVAPGAKDPATVGTWDIEASSINLMEHEGWNRASYKPGDPITLVGHPMKDGSKGALLFYAVKPDGTRLGRADHRYAGESE